MTQRHTIERADDAWAVLEKCVTAAKVIEFANLLLSFEASGANGNGALYFNANQGHPQEWGVRSETVARVNSLTRKAKRA